MIIRDVQTLSIAFVHYQDGEIVRKELVYMDLINNKVYNENFEIHSNSEEILSFLQESNEIPEEFFAAPPEIIEKAQHAYREAEMWKGEAVQDIHVSEENADKTVSSEETENIEISTDSEMENKE